MAAGQYAPLDHRAQISAQPPPLPPLFLARFTVPVLWDKKTHTIVNNESAEIIRIFNTAFNDLLPPEKASVDIYPEQHRQEIDAINAWVYDTVNSTQRFFLGGEAPLS